MVFSGARDLMLGLILHLLPYSVFASSKGSKEIEDLT